MKMAVTLSLLFPLFLLTLTSNAFDITQILNQYPDLSTFNSYLTQTNLAADINSRQTITVLAVNNAAISPLSGNSLDLIKKVLSVHVLLDYFDAVKLQQLSANSALVTTLFQASGLARGQQGFLNVTSFGGGIIAFGSAMPGSPLASTFVSSVVSQPYNISVIQVSSVIMPQGIDGSKTSSPPSVSPSASSVPTPPPSSVADATAAPLSTDAAAATAPSPSSATGATAPPPSSVAGATPPAAAPPTASSAAVPATAPTTASSTPAPASSSAPTMAATPTATSTISGPPASSPAANAPGGASTEEPAGTTPAVGKPAGKSAGTSLHVGGFTMLSSAIFLALASRI